MEKMPSEIVKEILDEEEEFFKRREQYDDAFLNKIRRTILKTVGVFIGSLIAVGLFALSIMFKMNARIAVLDAYRIETLNKMTTGLESESELRRSTDLELRNKIDKLENKFDQILEELQHQR